MGINNINSSFGSSTIRNLNNLISQRLEKSMNRLSSGLRINRAGDDAAGFTVASRLQAQIGAITQAIENAESSINMSNVASQSLGSTSENLLRIRELAVQAANTGVYGPEARQALQAEAFQNIDEINRVAQTTQFGTNHLLNGDFSASATISSGQADAGVSVSGEPTASSLSTGTNYLQVTEVRGADAQIIANDGAGNQQVMNTGLTNATDIAVTAAQFVDSAGGGGTAAAGTALTDQTFNGATLQSGGAINFSGVLADGVTTFSGTFSVGAASDLAGGGGAGTSLADTIQQAIDQAETAAGIDTAGGTGSGETNVQYNDTTGRLEFVSGGGEEISQFSVDFSVQDAAGDVQTQGGVTRQADINGQATGAQIGNNVDALTGSTFDTGQLAIQVSDVQAAQTREVESSAGFAGAGGGAATGATELVGSTFGGATLAAGDTITVNGTNADGTTFSSEITIAAAGGDGAVGNGVAATLDDLTAELNVRDSTLVAGGAGNQSGFTDATATLSGSGQIQVTDDLATTGSQTSFTLVANDNTPGGNDFGTIASGADVVRAGNAERATVSIGGGPGQTVEAGQVVTLQGPDAGPFAETPEITLRIGSGLTAGQDLLATESGVYTGELNGGEAITFQNGDQDVTFVSGRSSGVAETLTLDFDSIVDVAGAGTGDTLTVQISSVSSAANFQIGAYAGDQIGLNLGDTSASALGLGTGQSVADIDISTAEGANEALGIIDAALDQVSSSQGRMGAFQNRSESSINSLYVQRENLMSSLSRIQDADMALESTNLASARMLLQANIAVLAQSNELRKNMMTGLLG